MIIPQRDKKIKPQKVIQLHKRKKILNVILTIKMNSSFDFNPENGSMTQKLARGAIFVQFQGVLKLGQNWVGRLYKRSKGHFQFNLYSCDFEIFWSFERDNDGAKRYPNWIPPFQAQLITQSTSTVWCLDKFFIFWVFWANFFHFNIFS